MASFFPTPLLIFYYSIKTKNIIGSNILKVLDHFNQPTAPPLIIHTGNVNNAAIQNIFVNFGSFLIKSIRNNKKIINSPIKRTCCHHSKLNIKNPPRIKNTVKFTSEQYDVIFTTLDNQLIISMKVIPIIINAISKRNKISFNTNPSIAHLGFQ
jgi:hypothetical protein